MSVFGHRFLSLILRLCLCVIDLRCVQSSRVTAARRATTSCRVRAPPCRRRRRWLSCRTLKRLTMDNFIDRSVDATPAGARRVDRESLVLCKSTFQICGLLCVRDVTCRNKGVSMIDKRSHLKPRISCNVDNVNL